MASRSQINKGNLFRKARCNRLKSLKATPTTPEGDYRYPEVYAGKRSYLKLNWTYTDCNSSREIPRYICIFVVVVVVVVKLKKIFFFFLFFSFQFFSLLFSFKLPYYSPITPQLSFSYILIIFFQLGKKIVSLFFSFFLFFFYFFFFFFLFSFLSFLFLVFLSYFLLKSSNTPLLFLNFHFHLNITLQKKKEKKKEEREKPYF